MADQFIVFINFRRPDSYLVPTVSVGTYPKTLLRRIFLVIHQGTPERPYDRSNEDRWNEGKACPDPVPDTYPVRSRSRSQIRFIILDSGSGEGSTPSGAESWHFTPRSHPLAGCAGFMALPSFARQSLAEFPFPAGETV